MNKGLEALKELGKFVVDKTYVLKTEEQTKVFNYKTVRDLLPQYFATIEQELKALEIINNKDINVLILKYAFISSEGINYYNKQFGNAELHLTQEEYDLLKGVL